MDFGENGELIFEDRIEARVAAELFNNAGRQDLVDQMVPPLSQPTISWFQFGMAIAEQRIGKNPHDGIHRIEGDAAVDALKLLVDVSRMNHRVKPERTGTRKDYMGAKLIELRARLAEREAENKRVTVIGGIVIVNASREEIDSITNRSDFVTAYCKTRGWDPQNLSYEQIMEIRSQPSWQSPA